MLSVTFCLTKKGKDIVFTFYLNILQTMREKIMGTFFNMYSEMTLKSILYAVQSQMIHKPSSLIQLSQHVVNCVPHKAFCDREMARMDLARDV